VNTHVDFVGVLFIVWGLLIALIGVSTLALGIGAVAVIATSQSGGSQMAATLTAGLFLALAIIAILWGVAHVVVGVPLRQHKAWARLTALVLGSVDLVLLPFGTALGVYTLWTLLTERGKSCFAESLKSEV
jgi:hypothetical protein